MIAAPVHRLPHPRICSNPGCPAPATWATHRGNYCTTHTHPAHRRIAEALERANEALAVTGDA